MTAPALHGRRWLIPPVLALAWGLNWPAVKLMLSALPPFTLRSWGLCGAGLLMLAVALARGRPVRPPAGAWPVLVASSALSVAAFNLFTAFAQLNTTTSRAAVLTYTMPVMMVGIAWALLGERPTRRSFAAMLIGGLGIGLLAWPALAPALEGALPRRALLGLAMPLCAALAWGLGTVVAKRWTLAGDKLVNVGWQLVLGGLVAVAGALATGESVSGPVPARVWAALAFHIVIATALGYGLWFVLLERTSASVSSLTTLAVPVVGVLGAMMLAGERPAALDWIGFAAVLASAGVVMLPSRPAPSSHPAVPSSP